MAESKSITSTEREEEIKARKRAATKRYRQAHPEKIRAKKKAYRERNLEKEKAYTKARYAANREANIARLRAWRAENPERSRAVAKAWRDANPERHKANVIAWQAANPEKVKVYVKTGKVRKYGLTLEQFDEFIRACGGRCPLCNVEFVASSRSRECACIDHCHKSGKVRGVICKRCNIGIGHARENPEILKAWLSYITSHASSQNASHRRQVDSQSDRSSSR